MENWDAAVHFGLMRAKIRHLCYLTDICGFFSVPRAFIALFSLILLNAVFFYSKPETDVTNYVQMLHLRTQVCFTASFAQQCQNQASVYCIIYFFAFVTGAKELIAKLIAKERNPLLLLLLL